MTIVFVIAATVLIALGKAQEGAILIGLIVTTIPSLLGSAFAERTSRDIRNGVLENVVQSGAQAALDRTGVSESVSDFRQTTPAALKALTVLLEKVVVSTEINTVSTDLNTHERKVENEG